MSTEITTSFIQGFKQGIDILSQQRGSKLQMSVRNEMQNSKQDHYDQIVLRRLSSERLNTATLRWSTLRTPDATAR